MSASPTAVSSTDHLAELKKYCDSDLERDWLDFLEQHNLHLPDTAQKFIEACHTKPDFWYADSYTAVFIDGPDHDHADIQAKDVQIDNCLELNLGVTAVRFHYLADWLTIVQQHPAIFGKVAE